MDFDHHGEAVKATFSSYSAFISYQHIFLYTRLIIHGKVHLINCDACVLL